ncbi:MDR family MFS transporter [Lederbergia lenta]|uniref:Putative efflux transporter n=1 Tax=Lederbergia lenta TaxID=1467 RepID=A0A2X4WRM2_LEDLE|nr:MFS transporter [Lederbergia lenta]MCM3113412.1 MFS transporter [Lederbergia lenta]MEC2326443.1 MFS transporter [Lederbergia lenta]SQI61252.1 putative efflux transporter [Lederbergia lenta]
MPKALWLLVIGMLVNVTGASFLWPLNAIYIHDHLGKSLSIAGFVLMLNSAGSVIGNLLGGFLYDKLGGYRSIMLGIIISVVALTGLTFWHGWPLYVIFLIIIGFGSGIIFPSMFAMAGFVWKEGGRKAFNAVYVAQNAGVAIGSALGGFVASFSFDYIFLANLLMYIAFLFIAFFGYRNIAGQQLKQTNVLQQRKPIKNKHKLYALIILCGAYFLGWVAYVQWQSTIAAYTQVVNISLKQYSILWTINGALIVLAQPLLQWSLRKYSNQLKGQIIVGLSIFIISFGVAGVADDFKGFLAAMIILTMGEMLVWPVVPTVANQLAPKGREGFYQGIVNSTATSGRMIGPVLGGILVDMYGMSVLFGFLIGLLLVALILACFYERPLKATGIQTNKQ